MSSFGLEIPALGTGLGALKVARTCGVCRKPLGLELSLASLRTRAIFVARGHCDLKCVSGMLPYQRASSLDPVNTGLGRLGVRVDMSQVILLEEGC